MTITVASAPQARHTMTRPARTSQSLPGVVEVRGSLNRRRACGAAWAPVPRRRDAVPPPGCPCGGPAVTVVLIADPPRMLPSSEPTHHDVLYFARNSGLLWVNASRQVGVHGREILLAAQGDRGPSPQVDPVAVVQRDHVSGRYLAAVEQRAIGRARVQDGPRAVWGGEQQQVQAADPGVHGRPGQVYLRFHAPDRAAPSDPHLLAAELESPFGAEGRERHGPAGETPLELHAVEVQPVRRDYHRPGGRGELRHGSGRRGRRRRFRGRTG